MFKFKDRLSYEGQKALGFAGSYLYGNLPFLSYEQKKKEK